MENEKEIKDAIGLELDYLNRVNGGCVGYKNSSNKIDIWTDYLVKYRAYPNRNSKIKYNAEEFALATTIALGHGCIIDEKWSSCYPRRKKPMTEPGPWDALHFVAGRWAKGNLWLEAYKEAYDDNFFKLKDHFKRYSACNDFTNKKEVQKFIKG